MSKPTQAEVADLVGRLRLFNDDGKYPITAEAADALESLAWEGAEPDWVALNDEDRQAVFMSMHGGLEGFLKTWGWLQFAKAIEDALRTKNAAPYAKPVGELPPLPEPLFDDPKGHGHDLYDAEQMRAYALRALRERA